MLPEVDKKSTNTKNQANFYVNQNSPTTSIKYTCWSGFGSPDAIVVHRHVNC